MNARRKALIVANDEYEQEQLRDLLAPAADAEALDRVLSDEQIGGFAVQVIRNQPAHDIAARIEDLFAESRPDDLLLLHYSGHGIKSESGELFLAASNTRPTRLRATAVAADFVLQCMRDSRSRSIVLLLDCCYAGAFPQGARPRAAGDINVLDSFSREKSGGRGRAVITASSAMEYAFEDGQLADDQHGQPSVFTAALVEGLSTGEADQDGDGWVALAELYNYVFDKVRDLNPYQTPGCRYDVEGELYLARSTRARARMAKIPPDLRAAAGSHDIYARLGAVGELRARLDSDELPVAVSAYEALAELAGNDTRLVAEPAAAALGEAAPRPSPAELDFGQAATGSVPPRRTVRLLGPPIARACAARPSDPRIRVDQMADRLNVSIDTSSPGTLQGSITLEGPGGRADIAVRAAVSPATPAAAAPTLPSPAQSSPAQSSPAQSSPAQSSPAQSSPALSSPALSRAQPPVPEPLTADAPAPRAAVAVMPAVPAEAQALAGSLPGQPAGPAQSSRPPAGLVTSPPAHPKRPRQQGPLSVRRAALPVVFILAALGCRLAVLCLDAGISFATSVGPGPGIAVTLLSLLGVILALVGVRRNALVSSILLWDLTGSFIYWITIRQPQDYDSTELRWLVVECVVAAAGSAILFAWSVTRAARGHRPSWFFAGFTAIGAAANAIAAYAWSLQPCPNRAPWIVLGVLCIALTLAGLASVPAFRSAVSRAR